MKSGRKKEGNGKYRLESRLAHGDIKKQIAKQHSNKIGGTVDPERIALEVPEIADCAGKLERQMRDIIHGNTTQSSAFNIATFNTGTEQISYNTPQESWTNADVRWSLTNSLQAGLLIYNGVGLSKAHRNPAKPGQKKRGPKPKAVEVT